MFHFFDGSVHVILLYCTVHNMILFNNQANKKSFFKLALSEYSFKKNFLSTLKKLFQELSRRIIYAICAI